MTVQENIAQYSDHLQDFAFIDSLLKSTERQVVYDTVADLLRSGQRGLTWTINMFVLDVMLLAPAEIAQPFREGFYTSKIVDALNDNVFARPHIVRCNAVYTIGKVGLKSSTDVLIKAFEYYLEKDPLLLPALLFELRWLGDEQQWNHIERMMRSTSYLTRWATLSSYLFANFSIPQNKDEARYSELQQHYLERLKLDSDNRIRDEADYKVSEYRFYQTAFHSKQDRRNARKALTSHIPSLTFDSIQLRFTNHLAQTDKNDYSLSELDAFVVLIEV
jgi:hypothetical protein